MGSSLVWSNDEEFTLDGVRYVAEGYVGTAHRTTPDQLLLLKPRSEIESYEALIDATNPRSIVELGIYKGGSTALLAQLAHPRKLVAIDLKDGCPPLESFIDAQGLRGVVATYYGIDQSNVQQLDEILAREFAGEPVDLIVDDASHLLPATKESFNRLFPHLRPGGLYVIEDWGWAHSRFLTGPDRYQDVAPLSAFICELVIAAACRPAVIAGITLDVNKAIVRRGPRELDPTVFDISAHFDPVGRDMVDRLSPVRTRTAE